MSDIQFEIQYLSENMGFADGIAEWIYHEFIKDIRKGVTLEDVARAVKNCNKDTLPIRLAAVANGQCVGTVAIIENDLKGKAYTPWLAALYVDKRYRGQGIGEALINFVKALVLQLGYSEVYLRTEHASAYYKRLGWRHVENCVDEFGLETDVFHYPLGMR